MTYIIDWTIDGRTWYGCRGCAYNELKAGESYHHCLYGNKKRLGHIISEWIGKLGISPCGGCSRRIGWLNWLDWKVRG